MTLEFVIFDELKGLKDDPKDLVQPSFLDTFFLFLIYTEVGAVRKSYQNQLLPGRGQAGGSFLTIQVGSFPSSTQIFS